MMRATDRNHEGGTVPWFRFVRPHLDLGLFVAGLLTLAFGYGVVVGKGLAFPAVVINRAAEAARDWSRNWRQYLGLRSEFVLPSARTAGGVTRYDRTAAWPGYTFLTMFHDGRFGAVLVDMDGRMLHRWDVTVSRIWPQGVWYRGVRLPDDGVDIHGTTLLPNGDAILNLGEAGTVRVDRCSRVLWKVPGETHHAVDYLPNGETLIPARHERATASPARPRLRPGPNGFYWEDTLLRVRPNGSVAEQVAILDMLYRSGWQSLLLAAPGSDAVVRSEDPTHLNDAEVLREDMAPAFPMFRAGDVLLSLRNLNTLLVADQRTWRVKWAMTGPFLGQHDPDFLPNGHIMVFDNRATGATPSFGSSRLLEIDPLTREIVWSYDGDDEPFYTRERGSQQVLPNGDVLVTDALEGRVFEVTRGSPSRIVWEYVNLVRPGFVGLVTGADRYAPERLAFLDAGACG